MVSGLAAIKQRKQEREEAANRPKANWFSFKKDGPDTLNVRFLQELDEEAANYDPEQGLAVIAVERVSPYDFKKRALCTLESEGKCYPEEWHRAAQESGVDKNGAEYKGGWKQKEFFYITVLVERDGKVQTEIIQRNLHSAFVADLLEIHDDEGTLTDRTYTIKKRGTGTQTQWVIKPAKEQIDVGDHKAYDLDSVALRHIPYDQQPAFFGEGKVSTGSNEPVATKAAAEDDEW